MAAGFKGRENRFVGTGPRRGKRLCDGNPSYPVPRWLGSCAATVHYQGAPASRLAPDLRRPQWPGSLCRVVHGVIGFLGEVCESCCASTAVQPKHGKVMGTRQLQASVLWVQNRRSGGEEVMGSSCRKNKMAVRRRRSLHPRGRRLPGQRQGSTRASCLPILRQLRSPASSLLPGQKARLV